MIFRVFGQGGSVKAYVAERPRRGFSEGGKVQSRLMVVMCLWRELGPLVGQVYG